MEKLKLSFISALTLLILLVSCKQEDIPTIAVENEVNTFIWSALTSWYYWQSDVSNLRDDRFDSKNKLNTFLNGYTDPNLLFEDLKYPDDRFSWIVDDYQTLDQYFAGVTTSFGFKYGLDRWSQDSVLGYVKYVVPESPATTRSAFMREPHHLGALPLDLPDVDVKLLLQSTCIYWCGPNPTRSRANLHPSLLVRQALGAGRKVGMRRSRRE